MTKPDSNRLELLVLKTSRNIRRAYDMRLAPLNLNMTEATLLRVLSDDGAMTQRELADQLHIGRASLGAFVDGLQARGLVERNSEASDRRVWKVTATRSAAPLVKQILAIDAELQSLFRSGIASSQVDMMMRTLRQFDSNTEAALAQ